MRLLAAALVCAASAGTTASAAVRVLRGHEFCEAAFRGDLKKMKMAILDGADVEYPCPSRSRETKSIRTVSALYIASQNGLDASGAALDGRDTGLDDAGPELRAEENHRGVERPAAARTGRLAALL